MAWSGSTYKKGNYSTNGWTGDAANNIGIEAGRHDVQDDDFAQGISDCINKNGLNSPTTNLPMGGYKHTNVAAATNTTDYSRFDQVMDRAGTQAATGNMNLGANRITNIGSATASTDAARFDQVMDRAGTNAATANISLGGFKITNLANGTASTDAATYGQMTTLAGVNTPPGVINMYAAATAPTGWLLCDGSAISRTTYAALFAIISTVYGVGDGSTTFNIPNLQQRFPLGKAASGTGSTLGGTGGAIDHTHSIPAHYHSLGTAAVVTGGAHGHGFTLTADSAGAHTHTVNTATTTKLTSNTGGFTVREDGTSTTSSSGAHTHTVSGTIGGGDGTHTHSLSGLVGSTGSGINGDAAMTSGTNNPPFLVVNYIIKT